MNVRSVQSMSRDRLAVDGHGQVLLADDAIDLDIAGALDTLSDSRDLIGFIDQNVEIVAEHFDRDVGADAGDHLIHTVGDRLGHHHVDARHRCQAFTNLLGDIVLCQSFAFLGRRELDHRVALVVAGGIDGRFAAAEPRNDRASRPEFPSPGGWLPSPSRWIHRAKCSERDPCSVRSCLPSAPG